MLYNESLNKLIKGVLDKRVFLRFTVKNLLIFSICMSLAGMFFVFNLVNANDPVCGNTILESGEACDDGNLASGDGCSDTCQIEGLVLCGNGLLDSGEQCDAGIENGVICLANYGASCSYCSNVCQTINVTGPYCGDGVLNGAEECDDGNFISGDGCSASCQNEQQGLCSVDLDVVIIMDRSGSMNNDTPTRLSQGKIVANSFVDKLRSSDQSALVSFATSANLDKPLSNNHALTKSFIDALLANGATDIGEAIHIANEEHKSINSNPSALKIEILLTDGKANKPNGTGFGEDPIDVAYAESEAVEAANSGIKIFSIGLGVDINEIMLQNIATTTGGKYYFAPTASDLASIFNDIALEACQFSSISGCKYSDANNDGNIVGDEKLPGWKIKLSGAATAEKITDATGCYIFTGLKAGTYSVAEDVNQSVNYTQTFPINPSDYTINLTNGENKTAIDFANYFAICGNSIKDISEECDNGLSNGQLCIPPYNGTCQYCNTQCKAITIGDGTCGDGQIDAGHEECDNGGNNGVVCAAPYAGTCSYCSNVCQNVSITGPFCGDGVKNGQEQCDGTDGVTANHQCNTSCVLELLAFCGDGIVNGSEECDDGNAISGDGCSTQCLFDLGSIKICKYEDADGSMATINDRIPLSSWSFVINSSTSTLATTTSATTKNNGCAVVNNLPVGSYEINENAKAGWFDINPISGKATTTVLANTESLKNFYSTRFGQISGYNYKDDDGLASTTNDRGPLSGWVINLFSSASTSTPITTATTNDQGYYEFKNLSPGNYSVTENIINGWIQIQAPADPIVVLGGSSKEDNNFVNRLTSYCGDGKKQSPNERGVNEECDTNDGVGAGQRCTLQCLLELIFVPAISGGGGGGGGGILISYPRPIIGNPILIVEKNVEDEFVNPGDKTKYTVKVTNTGSSTALAVILKDVLPRGLVFAGDNKTERNVSLGDIKAGETKTIEYEIIVNKDTKSGFYSNFAKVSADNYGPVSDVADLEVREVKVLGEELTPTGFEKNEFLALLAGLLFIVTAIITSKKKLIKLESRCL